jgi:hypothetical protein
MCVVYTPLISSHHTDVLWLIARPGTCIGTQQCDDLLICLAATSLVPVRMGRSLTAVEASARYRTGYSRSHEFHSIVLKAPALHVSNSHLVLSQVANSELPDTVRRSIRHTYVVRQHIRQHAQKSHFRSGRLTDDAPTKKKRPHPEDNDKSYGQMAREVVNAMSHSL